jgi:hypothetical protein
MKTEHQDFALRNHFTILVYPFLHGLTPANQQTILQSLAPAWTPWWSRLADDKLAKAIDDTFFFLPYIRGVLFPETSLFTGHAPGQQYANWVAIIRKISKSRITHLCEDLPPGSNLRLTYDQSHLSPTCADFAIFAQYPPNDGETSAGLSARLEWIDCMLFSSGIGFLLLKVRLNGTTPKLSQLIDLNYYLRAVHPPTIPWTLPTIRFEGEPTHITLREFLDYLTQGMTEPGELITAELGDFVDDLRVSNRNRMTDTEFGQVFGERCQIFSYACIDIDQAGKNEVATGPFRTGVDRVLYEFASCIPLGDSVSNAMWIPSEESVEGLASNKISAWRSWQGMAFRESVVFLATEDIPFNKQNFPDNLESDYVPLYVYTLYQKFQLFMFSSDLMRKGADIEQNLHEVRALVERFVVFRSRYWFNEITRKAMGGELYQKFQTGLGVTSLYQLVCGEIRDMEDYYERRNEKRSTFLINLFTFVFVPLGAVIGVFGMTFFTGSWKQLIISCVLVGLASLALWIWRAEK